MGQFSSSLYTSLSYAEPGVREFAASVHARIILDWQFFTTTWKDVFSHLLAKALQACTELETWRIQRGLASWTEALGAAPAEEVDDVKAMLGVLVGSALLGSIDPWQLPAYDETWNPTLQVLHKCVECVRPSKSELLETLSSLSLVHEDAAYQYLALIGMLFAEHLPFFEGTPLEEIVFTIATRLVSAAPGSWETVLEEAVDNATDAAAETNDLFAVLVEWATNVTSNVIYTDATYGFNGYEPTDFATADHEHTIYYRKTDIVDNAFGLFGHDHAYFSFHFARADHEHDEYLRSPEPVEYLLGSGWLLGFDEVALADHVHPYLTSSSAVTATRFLMIEDSKVKTVGWSDDDLPLAPASHTHDPDGAIPPYPQLPLRSDGLVMLLRKDLPAELTYALTGKSAAYFAKASHTHPQYITWDEAREIAISRDEVANLHLLDVSLVNAAELLRAAKGWRVNDRVLHVYSDTIEASGRVTIAVPNPRFVFVSLAADDPNMTLPAAQLWNDRVELVNEGRATVNILVLYEPQMPPQPKRVVVR